LQHESIEQAKIVLSALPITIFGPFRDEGDARNLKAQAKRWHSLYQGEHPEAKGFPHRLFADDHIQQHKGFNSDYQKLEAVVNEHSLFITTHPGTVVIDVSQLSTTSIRLERQGMGPAQAKGGGKLGAEINVLFRTTYDKDATPHLIGIAVEETRRRPPVPVVQEIEPNSGAFLRPAYPAKEKYRHVEEEA
jgi:hypothetical protein